MGWMGYEKIKLSPFNNFVIKIEYYSAAMGWPGSLSKGSDLDLYVGVTIGKKIIILYNILAI